MDRLLPIALAGALAACGGSSAGRCPGNAVATLTFPEAPAASTCGVEFPPVPPFAVTLSIDPAGGTRAWLCTGRRLAEPLAGTLEGDALDVSSAEAAPAALPPCGPACAAMLTERVAGTVRRGPAGEIVGFSGTLVDTAIVVVERGGAPSCGPCATGCAVTYPLVTP